MATQVKTSDTAKANAAFVRETRKLYQTGQLSQKDYVSTISKVATQNAQAPTAQRTETAKSVISSSKSSSKTTPEPTVSVLNQFTPVAAATPSSSLLTSEQTAIKTPSYTSFLKPEQTSVSLKSGGYVLSTGEKTSELSKAQADVSSQKTPFLESPKTVVPAYTSFLSGSGSSKKSGGYVLSTGEKTTDLAKAQTNATASKVSTELGKSFLPQTILNEKQKLPGFKLPSYTENVIQNIAAREREKVNPLMSSSGFKLPSYTESVNVNPYIKNLTFGEIFNPPQDRTFTLPVVPNGMTQAKVDEINLLQRGAEVKKNPKITSKQRYDEIQQLISDKIKEKNSFMEEKGISEKNFMLVGGSDADKQKVYDYTNQISAVQNQRYTPITKEEQKAIWFKNNYPEYLREVDSETLKMLDSKGIDLDQYAYVSDGIDYRSLPIKNKIDVYRIVNPNIGNEYDNIKQNLMLKYTTQSSEYSADDTAKTDFSQLSKGSTVGEQLTSALDINSYLARQPITYNVVIDDKTGLPSFYNPGKIEVETQAKSGVDFKGDVIDKFHYDIIINKLNDDGTRHKKKNVVEKLTNFLTSSEEQENSDKYRTALEIRNLVKESSPEFSNTRFNLQGTTQAYEGNVSLIESMFGKRKDLVLTTPDTRRFIDKNNSLITVKDENAVKDLFAKQNALKRENERYKEQYEKYLASGGKSLEEEYKKEKDVLYTKYPNIEGVVIKANEKNAELIELNKQFDSGSIPFETYSGLFSNIENKYNLGNVEEDLIKYSSIIEKRNAALEDAGLFSQSKELETKSQNLDDEYQSLIAKGSITSGVSFSDGIKTNLVKQSDIDTRFIVSQIGTFGFYDAGEERRASRGAKIISDVGTTAEQYLIGAGVAKLAFSGGKVGAATTKMLSSTPVRYASEGVTGELVDIGQAYLKQREEIGINLEKKDYGKAALNLAYGYGLEKIGDKLTGKGFGDVVGVSGGSEKLFKLYPKEKGLMKIFEVDTGVKETGFAKFLDDAGIDFKFKRSSAYDLGVVRGDPLTADFYVKAKVDMKQKKFVPSNKVEYENVYDFKGVSFKDIQGSVIKSDYANPRFKNLPEASKDFVFSENGPIKYKNVKVKVEKPAKSETSQKTGNYAQPETRVAPYEYKFLRTPKVEKTDRNSLVSKYKKIGYEGVDVRATGEVQKMFSQKDLTKTEQKWTVDKLNKLLDTTRKKEVGFKIEKTGKLEKVEKTELKNERLPDKFPDKYIIEKIDRIDRIDKLDKLYKGFELIPPLLQPINLGSFEGAGSGGKGGRGSKTWTVTNALRDLGGEFRAKLSGTQQKYLSGSRSQSISKKLKAML
jgi:hypothetical protein